MKLCLAIASVLTAFAAFSDPDSSAVAAFRDARFGMFIHYGLYAQLGGRWKGQQMEYIGEWIQAKFRIPNAEYSLLAKEFNPVKFDADEWAKSAKDAGMEYVVLTAKHHEGFSMFATKASDYNIVDATPFKRDLYGELAAACRRHGLKVGFYYSQCLDWHEFDAGDLVEARGSNKGMDWGNSWDWPDASKKDIHRYLKAKVYPQVRELLTNYGEIFCIWFDCPQQMTLEDTKELNDFVHSIQPQVMVNSRIGHGLGDYGSLGDNQMLAGKSEFPLETPMTLNDTWGFKYDDHNWKSGYRVACYLAQTISCNANLLLNVGPRPDGRFPDATSDVLAELGAWRRRTGFAIRGSKSSPFPSALPWGWCTFGPDGALQFVIRREWKGDLEVCGIRNRVTGCTHGFRQQGETLHINLPEPADSMPRVVRVMIDGVLDVDQSLMPQNGTLALLPGAGSVTAKSAGDNEGVVLGAAAERLGGGECKVSQRGALRSWHHPGDRISWKVVFPSAGRYRAYAVTESWKHGAVWQSDRKARLSVGNVSIDTELKKDVNLPHTVYDRVESLLGEIEVNAGACEVSLETLSASADARFHDLTELRFVRQ